MHKEDVFARRLREMRIRRGYTQEYMASMLQIKVGTYSGYERNYRRPDIDMVKKIAAVLNVSADYLLGLEASPRPPQEGDEEIDLEQFIRDHNIRIFGDRIDDDVKEDIMTALRAIIRLMKKEAAPENPNKG